MSTFLKEVDIKSLIATETTTDGKTQMLGSIINFGLDSLIPITTKTIYSNEPPWMSKSLKQVLPCTIQVTSCQLYRIANQIDSL